MKCDEYREAITAEPSGQIAELGTHASNCTACRRFRRGIQAFDALIAAALAIDVPPMRIPELPRVYLTATAGIGDVRPAWSGRIRTPSWIAFAAALAVAAVLVTRFLTPELASPSLAAQVIAHMDHEQHSRQVTSVEVSREALGGVLDAQVLTMDAGGSLVTYARHCVINNKTVPHLVIQGAQGPITLILLPQEAVDSAILLSTESSHGVIVPVGSGSIAIIGERAEQLREIDEIGKRLEQTVTWRT